MDDTWIILDICGKRYGIEVYTSPNPSCPFYYKKKITLLVPNEKIFPFKSEVNEWYPPAIICFILNSDGIKTGENLFMLSPSPSWFP